MSFMTMTVREYGISESYYDVRDLIYSVCHKFRRQYGGDFEELFAQALVLFVDKAYDGYDDDSSTKFSAYVWFTIHRGLMDEYRRNIRRKNSLPQEPLLDMPVHNERFDFDDFFYEASEDCKLVASLVLMPPDELETEFVFDWDWTVTGCKQAIRDYLMNFFEWTPRRISRAFRELTEELI